MSNNFAANFHSGLENQPKTGTVSFCKWLDPPMKSIQQSGILAVELSLGANKNAK
jgi:hypothetical protein